MPAEPQPLTSLAVGQSGTVLDVRAEPKRRSRLMELGLVPGTPVELVRFALLGDPVEIKVRGYHLTVRRHEAEQIWVNEPVSG
jgi:ferrous iron transport protein A